MQLFNSILQGNAVGAPPAERRSEQRYAVSPDFPLKAVISYIGRDDTGAPMSLSRAGWNWKGQLLDCSEEGARMRLGPGLKAVVGESCDLKLTVQDFNLTVPCHVVNVQEDGGDIIYGLKHAIDDADTLAAYGQLVEVLALAATLKARFSEPRPDKNGYLVEQFANDRPARLTIWREPRSRGVIAFEFLLKEDIVQAASGQAMEYLTGTEATGAVAAGAAKALEIHRLFTWVLPNLPAEVPVDVREFLRIYV
jgi:hypothetical protein